MLLLSEMVILSRILAIGLLFISTGSENKSVLKRVTNSIVATVGDIGELVKQNFTPDIPWYANMDDLDALLARIQYIDNKHCQSTHCSIGKYLQGKKVRTAYLVISSLKYCVGRITNVGPIGVGCLAVMLCCIATIIATRGVPYMLSRCTIALVDYLKVIELEQKRLERKLQQQEQQLEEQLDQEQYFLEHYSDYEYVEYEYVGTQRKAINPKKTRKQQQQQPQHQQRQQYYNRAKAQQ